MFIIYYINIFYYNNIEVFLFFRSIAMQTFSLFNIGFRSENICEALRDYKETGEMIHDSILEDSKKIIEDCSKFNNVASLNSFMSKYNIYDLLNYIYENYKNNIECLDEVKRILYDLSEKKEKINIDKALDFFQSLSNYCLIKNRKPIPIEFSFA
jgi:hypothetical protein